MVKIGEFAALIAALAWTISAFPFESASKKSSAMMVNIIRLFIAFIIMGVFLSFQNKFFIPVNIEKKSFIFLTLSGFTGFVIAGQLLLKAFTIIGAKITMIILTLVPPSAAVMGFVFLNETLSFKKILGICVTLFGISLVLASKKSNFKIANEKKYLGVIYAILSAISQGAGMVLAKYGLQGVDDAYSATQVRVIGGLLGFIPIIFVTNSFLPIIKVFKNFSILKIIIFGAIVNVIGVIFSIVSIKNIYTGVSATLMAVSPILMIPAAYFVFKQRTNFLEILGAIIGVTGVAILFN